MSKKKDNVLKVDNLNFLIDSFSSIQKQNEVLSSDYIKILNERDHFFRDIKIEIFKIKYFLNHKHQILYVFVGKFNEELQIIFDSIQKNFKFNLNIVEKLSQKQKDILTKYYGPYYYNELGLKNIDCNEIKFIPDLITYEDSIELISNKIFLNIKIKPNKQYLWINLFDKKYVSLKKKKLYSLFINDNGDINFINLLNDLKKIFPKNDISSQSLKLDKINTININDSLFLSFEEVNNLIDFSFENLKFKTNSIYDFITFKNPFLTDLNSINYNNFKKNINIIEIGKKILVDYGKIKNNIINVLSYDSFDNNIKKPNNIINILFPNYELKNYNRDIIKSNIEFHNIFNDYFHLNKNDGKIKCIYSSLLWVSLRINNNSTNNNIVYNLSSKINNKNNINLDFIYENLKLGFNIPFIRFKAENQQHFRCKLYLPIVNPRPKCNNVSSPLIDEKRLELWGFNTHKKKIDNKFDNYGYKGLTIKLFLFKKNNKSNYATLRIHSNSLIDVNLHFTEKDYCSYSYIELALKKCYNFLNDINNLIKYDINNNAKIKLPEVNLNSENNINTIINGLNLKYKIKSKKDISILQIRDVCEKIPLFVKIINHNLDNITFRYLKISKDYNINEIINWLENTKLEDSNISDLELNEFIQEKFNKTFDEADYILNQWNNEKELKLSNPNTNKNFNNYYNKNLYGIEITIKLETPTYYTIKIQGVKNILQIPYINNFIKTIFLILINNYNLKEKLDNLKFSEKNKLLDFDQDDDSDMINSIDSLSIFDSNSYSNISEYNDNEDKNNEDSDNDNEDSLPNISARNNANLQENVDVSQENNNDLLESNNDRNYHVDRLTKYDPELFGDPSKMNGSNGYVKKCQSVQRKQPIVINEEQKLNIEKNFKDPWISEDHILEYPLINNNKRYYICPVIWCKKCNLSLKPNDLVKNKFGERSCPKCGGIDTKIKSEYNLGIPRTLIIRDKGWDQNYQNYINKNKSTNEFFEGDFIKSGKWKDMYPGFIGICLPCCQKKNAISFQRNKKKCLEPDKISEKDVNKSNYVLDSQKFPLNDNKLGVLPGILNDIFLNDLNNLFINKRNSGELISNKFTYLRIGIQSTNENIYKNNSFLFAMKKIFFSLNNDLFNMEKSNSYKYNQFIDDILEKISLEKFISINQGDIVNIFNNNILRYKLTLHKLYSKDYNNNQSDALIIYFKQWCNENKAFIKKIYDTEFLYEKTFDLKSFLHLNFKNNKKIFQRINILDKLFEIFIARKNFEIFLHNFDNYKDPLMLMDIFKQPGILHPNGCNLLIFNNDKNNMNITCPLWDMSELIDKSHKRVFCCIVCNIKNNEKIFEPIINIKFDKKTDKRSYSFYIGKKDNDNNQVFDNLEKQTLYCTIRKNYLYEKYYKDHNLIFSKSSKEILYHLNKMKSNNQVNQWPNGNFTPVYQIVNNNFKSIGFIVPDLNNAKKPVDYSLNNKILIPFDPSGVIENIPIIFDISYYIPNSYQNTVDTLNYLNQIFEDDNSLNFTIVENIINNDNYTNFIKIITNNYIPVIPEKIKNNLPSNYQYIDLNMNLITNYNKKILDERIININRYLYEKNSFIKLKYELSTYLNINNNELTELLPKDLVLYKDSEYIISKAYKHNNTYQIKRKDKIIDNISYQDLIPVKYDSSNKGIIKKFISKIVNSDSIPNNIKRKILKNLFLTLDNKYYNDILNKYGIYLKNPLIKQIAVFNTKKNINHINSKNISIKRCQNFKKKIDCESENFCSWENNRCKLSINKQNLINPNIDNQEKYVNILIEELIKNKIKSNEVLHNKIEILKNLQIDKNFNKFEIEIKEEEFLEVIKKLYQSHESIFWTNPFDPLDINNYRISDQNSENLVSLNNIWISKTDQSDLFLNLEYIENKYISLEKIFDRSLSVLRNNLIDYYKSIDIKEIIYGYKKFNQNNNIKDYQDIINHINKNFFIYDIFSLSKIFNINIIILDNRYFSILNFRNNNLDEAFLLLYTDNYNNYYNFLLLYYLNNYKIKISDLSYQIRNQLSKFNINDDYNFISYDQAYDKNNNYPDQNLGK